MRIFRSSLQIAILLSITCYALSIPAVSNSDNTGNHPAPTAINQRRDVDPKEEAGATTTCNCRHRHHHHYYSDSDDVDPDDVDPADVDPANVDPDEVNPDDTEKVNSAPMLVVPVTVYANGTHYSTQTYLPATDSVATTSVSEPLMGIITGSTQPTSTLVPAGSSKTSGSASSASANAVQPNPSPASPKGSTNQEAAPIQEQPPNQPPIQPPQNQERPPSPAPSNQEPPSGQILPGQAPPGQVPAPSQPSQSQAPPSQASPSQAPASQGPPPSQPSPSQAPLSQPPSEVLSSQVSPPSQVPVSQSHVSSQVAAGSKVPPPSQAPVSQATASGQAAAASEVPPPSQASVSQGTASSQTTAASGVQPPSQESAPQALSASQLAATSQAASTSQKTPAAAPSNTTAAAVVPTPASTSNTSIPFLRGVNIGNWLILEKWMEPDLFTGAAAAAVDQWTFDSTPNAAAALHQHWSTWFTASDAKTLASYGINALRIPIGYWAYDAKDTPFIQGADHYLELAIQWARELNMKVWVDLHGSPGSQNGQDHSGHKGRMLWQRGDNLNRSTAVLVTMAKKYGSATYADVVVGLEIVNEPASTGNNSFPVSQQWAVDAYHAIKAVATNPNLVVVTHDSFQGPTTFVPIARSLGAAAGFGIDVHNYQLYTDADNALTQAEHIRKACAWAKDLRAAKASMPVYVGEWSALTNVCVNGDGSSTAGTSCSASGCQCVSGDPKGWNGKTVEAVRRYVEAQLDMWEGSTDGYFLWTFGGPGGWGVGNLVAAGAMPNPVTERKFPGQCG